MELTKETAKLVCNLEFLIGECCENNNSYNAYTDEYGCVFRYPVWVLRTDIVEENGCEKEVDNSFKTSLNLADLSNVVSIDDVRNIFYKFGSNELNIGIGLISVLEFLEKRYGLNFNELENQVKKNTLSTKITK